MEIMMATLDLCFLAILVLETALAILVNTFIVAVQCVEWVKRKHLGPLDMILMSLSLTRISLHGTTLLQHLIPAFCQEFYHRDLISDVSMITHMFTNYFAIWMSTCLCVFYTMRISICNHPLFLCLRQRISSRVLPLILGSFILSLLFSLPVAWNHFTTYTANTTGAFSPNTTFVIKELAKRDQYVYLSGTLLPCAIFCPAILLLVRDLWVHTRQMQRNSTSFRNPSLTAHFTALKSIGSFFILYVIFIVIVNLAFSGSIPLSPRWRIFYSILTSACPFMHSVILIPCNAKLSQASLKILSWSRLCPSENIPLNPSQKVPAATS